jgi:hypothetical protein
MEDSCRPQMLAEVEGTDEWLDLRSMPRRTTMAFDLVDCQAQCRSNPMPRYLPFRVSTSNVIKSPQETQLTVYHRFSCHKSCCKLHTRLLWVQGLVSVVALHPEKLGCVCSDIMKQYLWFDTVQSCAASPWQLGGFQYSSSRETANISVPSRGAMS